MFSMHSVARVHRTTISVLIPGCAVFLKISTRRGRVMGCLPVRLRVGWGIEGARTASTVEAIHPASGQPQGQSLLYTTRDLNWAGKFRPFPWWVGKEQSFHSSSGGMVEP